MGCLLHVCAKAHEADYQTKEKLGYGARRCEEDRKASHCELASALKDLKPPNSQFISASVTQACGHGKRVAECGSGDGGGHGCMIICRRSPLEQFVDVAWKLLAALVLFKLQVIQSFAQRERELLFFSFQEQPRL